MVMVQRHDEWRQVHQRLCGIAKRRAALDADEARCLREACRLKLWRELGYKHMCEYLETELGYAPQVGVERVRVACAMESLPQIEASLAEGELSYSAIRELTRVATPETKADWLARAHGRNLREIEQMVAGKKRGDRPDDPANPDLVNRAVRFELAPEVFALLRQMQNALADEHGARLDDNALVELLCRRALEGDASHDRPAHQIAYTVCESCGRGRQNGGGREIDVAPEVTDQAHCDAELLGSLDAEHPERVTTTVTQRMRRQVFARDHFACTVPGCRAARNLDIHHIEYQSEGGSHQLSNLTITCSACHRALHAGKLAIRGRAPDALTFEWRDGKRAKANDHRGDESGRAVHASIAGRSDASASAGPVVAAASTPPDAPSSATLSDDEVHTALVTMGFKPREARAAVTWARLHVGAAPTGEPVLRAALGELAQRRRTER